MVSSKGKASSIQQAQRIAVLDRDACIKDKCGYVCEKVCPVNKMGEEAIAIDEKTAYPVIVEAACIGCGICVKRCPTKAISIVNLTKDLGKLTFTYGVNAFRFYGFPLPVKGAVTAYVGRNGIGKTTAIRILSKQLTPNFGDYTKEWSWQDVLEEVPVHVAKYFNEIEGKELSVKPQNIEALRAFDGTVKGFIEHMGFSTRLLEKWNLKIADRKMKELSGGELQKLAVALAMEKEAELYFFDEPTNYLDIVERLNIAIKLGEFALDKNLVVVDHDLTILDYMADYVYVFFGAASVYGASSSVKSARVGINEYLQGYLKAENLRFRDYEIHFGSGAGGRGSSKASKVAFTYPALKKSFPSFSLSVEAGEIHEGEVVGIVGKNGLGKTVFMKMLAGVEKPDKGHVEADIKIAYKRQYLEADSTLVKELLNKVDDKAVLARAKQLLQIDDAIVEKQLNQLSGGQLQMVAIAYTISLDADLYLFDEPSAFLDVEERLAFSSLLREIAAEKKKPMFVVDHDVALVDRIADRIIVFEGESSVKGHAHAPIPKRNGLNLFLKLLGITLRRDVDTKRPKINKPWSKRDKEQREKGEYFADD